jgi:methylmalonyl-CoA mutase N-terminal domain/subunit
VSEPEREVTSLSGEPIAPRYGPEDLEGFDPQERLGEPGAFPYTRGVYPSMYRGRLWTMRQFAGYGTPAETNARYRFLLEKGQGGLSVAFDMPTLMGLDSDDPRAEGEVGRCGVATDSLEDFETLFDGIPLDEITTTMTINGPAAIAFAFYLATAEEQGVDRSRLDGTIQTDILKEYIAQKEWIFPPRPHLRLIGDMMAFCAEHMPKFHPLSVSGYHIREAGATAAQELAFTLADGFAYVELGLSRGLDPTVFVPGLSFFFNAHIDFFEEIAKYRAARRIWARWLRDRYGVTDANAMRLRFHGRRVADRPATDEQRGAHRDRGARRRPGGHAVAAHECAGRGAGAADGRSGEARASNPTGDRIRDRRVRRDRSARGVLLRGVDH